MKIWGIIATVLMLGFLGASVWMYTQNSNLKSKNDSLNSKVTAAESAQDKTAKKIAAASKKIEVLSIFLGGEMNQTESLRAYDLIKSMNDETLTADWTAMQTRIQDNSTGEKMMRDLIAAAANDLK